MPVDDTFDHAALLDALPELILVIGADAGIAYANRRLLDTMGYELEAVLGTNIFDYVHPDDHEYMVRTWENRTANPGQTGILVEARGRNADGSWRAIEALGLSLLGVPPVDGMIMTMRDLERKAGVGDTPHRLRSMVDRTTDIVLLLDAEARIAYANRRLTSRFGVDQDRVVGQPFTSLVPDTVHAEVQRWFSRLVAAGDRAEDHIRLPVTDRADLDALGTIDWHGTNQLDDPLIAGVIMSGRDVSRLVEVERRLEAQTEQLRHLAEHDALTGLANRRAFVADLAELVAERRALRDDGDVVVLFCDLDRFKAVNDAHGHAAGDHVLVESANRLRAVVRGDDVVARWGGDEFTVLLHDSPTEAEVDELVARITAALTARIGYRGATLEVGVSVGCSRAPVAKAELAALLRDADEAMYRRKSDPIR